MARWILWFGFGAVLFVSPYLWTGGGRTQGNAMAMLTAVAFVFWLWCTVIAVPIKIIWWLVAGRRRSVDA